MPEKTVSEAAGDSLEAGRCRVAETANTPLSGLETEILRHPPRPIDVEDLLQWAIHRSGRLPWMRDDWRQLSMNRGLTAKPKRREKIGWDLATVGLRLSTGRSVPAKMVPGPDATRVLAAVQALEPATAAVVLACARSRIRPDWMEGIVPRRVLRPIYGYKRNRQRRGRPILVPVWEPRSPADVAAAHAAYSRWHAALEQLAQRLRGELVGWDVVGLNAPPAPWD